MTGWTEARATIYSTAGLAGTYCGAAPATTGSTALAAPTGCSRERDATA
jgi:hypothetical protein